MGGVLRHTIFHHVTELLIANSAIRSLIEIYNFLHLLSVKLSLFAYGK